jgi:hypothetical protein
MEQGRGMQEIVLTAAQRARVQTFRREMEPLRARLAALEMGVHAMLATVVECAGAPEGASYALNESGSALVLQNGTGAE